MENRSEQRRRAVLEALARAIKPLIAARAKEKQKAGGGSGPSGRQKSAQPSKTREEAAALAGVNHNTFHKGKVALNHGSNPTRASPGTPTLGGQDQRTTDVATHESQNGDRGS